MSENPKALPKVVFYLGAPRIIIRIRFLDTFIFLIMTKTREAAWTPQSSLLHRPVASGRIARSWSPAKSIDEVFRTGLWVLFPLLVCSSVLEAR